MSATVITTEYGRPASAALAQAVVNAKDGMALAPVTVVVPSNFAGLAARRMLGSGALGVAGVANVNFVTPFRLAELLAVGELPRSKPLTNPVLGAAVRGALAEDPHHFRKVRDHQATARALAAIVGELANVSAASLDAIEASGGHAASIIALYRSIKSHLRGFHDEAQVAHAATHRNDLADALAPYGHLIWYLPGPLSAPLAGFLRSALGVAASATVVTATVEDVAIDREVHRSLRIAGVSLPGGDHFNDSDVPASELADQAEVARRDGAHQDHNHLPLADHVISVTDADEEVRAVIREVIQLVDDGTPLDRIGVFHPVPDPYVRILEQQLAAAEIPANGPSRRRLSEMIAGRVLLAALALPGERWRRDRVIALVNSGPLRHQDHVARPAVWDMLSRYAGVVSGLADWRVKLKVERNRLAVAMDEAAAVGNERRLDRLESQRRDVDDLASFIDDLADHIDTVRAAKGWRARSDAALAMLRSLLGPPQVRQWWPEPELQAFESVEAALDRLAMLEDIDPEPSLAVFTQALSLELSVARGRNGRFGHGLVYGPLSSAPGQDLDAVFVLGCTEGLCPAPRREDALLADSVRGLAGGDLPLRLGQIDEQHRLFLAAIAAAPEGRRWLFLPRGDLRSSRRSRPSRWLLPTASKIAGRRLYATDFEDHNPPGVHEVASHATALIDASHFTSVAERDVAAVYRYVRNGGEPAAHPASELVATGLAVQAARRGRAFTEYDGNLAGLAAPASTETMSASRLESWAECGFRYYLGYVLGLSERDDPERTIELSALDRGSAVHEILERFMREQVEAGPPAPDEPWSTDQRARALQLAHEVFDEYERRGRTGRRIEWETQKSDLLALVDEFLTADDAYRAETGATPAHFEMAFGLGDAPPLTVDIDDGRSLRFRGMIDRVDQGPHGIKLVSDYKTGKGTQYQRIAKDDDPTNGGTLLQLGLYAEAVDQHLGASAVDTRYWMVNTSAAHARYGYPWTPAHRERLVDVLTTIADGIETGVFAAIPGEFRSHFGTYENCTYCQFDGLCPRGRAEHASDKAEAPELAVRIGLKPTSESGDAAASGDTRGTGAEVA